VHGKTSAETNGAGQLQHAEVRLPVKLSINTPKACGTPAPATPR
jgi:hypothetical protein